MDTQSLRFLFLKAPNFQLPSFNRHKRKPVPMQGNNRRKVERIQKVAIITEQRKLTLDIPSVLPSKDTKTVTI